jgi:hypothetical protein
MITARRMSRAWAALLAIVGATALRAAETYNIADYFPLFPNSHWTLEDVTNPHPDDNDGFTWSVLGTGPQAVGSFSVWKVRTECVETTDARHLDQDFWNFYGGGTNPKLGLYGIYKGTAINGVPGNQSIVLSRALYMGDANMAEGWTSGTSTATANVLTSYGTVNVGFSAVTTLVRHLDSLTTPLGTFNDVILLAVDVKATTTFPFPLPNYTFNFINSRFWLARGVGLVRQNQMAVAEEAEYQALRSGKINGNDITPTGTVTHTVTFTAGAGGAISGTTPQTVAHGANATAVTASANAGFHFVRWTSAGVEYSTSPALTVTNVTANLTLTAEFAADAVTHTVSFLAGTGGSVSPSATQTIVHGANAAPVTASANAGYRFVRWTSAGVQYSTSAALTVTNVTTNLALTAEFALTTYTVTYAAGLHGSISGTTTQTITHGGSTTAVTAVAATGYHFVDWSDGSTANPRQDTNVTSNLAVTASFVANTVATEVQVLPDTLSVSCRAGTSPAAATFSVRNGLEGTLAYTLTESLSWLSVSPTSGSSSGEWDAIAVSFTAAALPPGTYEGDITVTGGTSVKTVHVTLNVTRFLAERRFPAGCYKPGDSVDVSVTLDPGAGGVVTSLAVYETLPAGWQFESVLSSPAPDLYPRPGSTETLQFSWLDIPSFPHTLIYRVTVPGGAAYDTYCFTGTTAYRTDGSEASVPIYGEACLEVGDCCVPHQADQDGDWHISLAPELTRLIQFYNLRSYHCQGGTEDGYTPGAGSTTCTPHQADQNGDWVIQLSPELTRLIQFYNSDGYRCAEGTEDGYAPGLARRKSATAPGALSAQRYVAAAPTAGARTLDVSITLTHTDPAALTSLSISERLPAGWTFAGVVSKSAPALQPPTGTTGALDFAWITVPAQWPFTLTYRVSLPAGAVGGNLLAGTASWREDAGEVSTPTPDGKLASALTAAAVAPSGSFLALMDAAGADAGQGLWDLTGAYTATIAGQPLTLNLTHDTTGRLAGSATLTLNAGKAGVQVTLPIRGATRGLGGALLVTLGGKSAATTDTASAALAFSLTLNAATRQLLGPVTGTITIDGVTAPVSETVVLNIPPPMDGAWTLRFELAPAGTGVTGTATLTLANGVQHLYTVRGKLSGQTVLASLSSLNDPAAKSLRTAITPLAGGGARLNALSGKSYGQSMLLSR